MKKIFAIALKEIGRALLLCAFLIPLISTLVPDIVHQWYHRGDPFLPYLEELSVEMVDFRKSETHGAVYMRVKNKSDCAMSRFTYEIEFYDGKNTFLGEIRERVAGFISVVDEEEASIDFEKPWFIENWDEVKTCKVKIVEVGGYGPMKKLL